MISSIQQKLLHHIDEHFLSYTKHWQDLYTQLYTLTLPEMQECVMTRLRHSGMSVQFLASDRPLFYAELQVGAEQTLLFYIDLPDLLPAMAASSIATALISYQSALDTCFLVLDSPPANIKLVFDGWGIQQDPGNVMYDRTNYSSLLYADRCILYVSEQKPFTADALPLLALGTKGSLRVELTVQAASTLIEARYGAIAPNAVWQLLWALATVKDRREDILIEGFYDALLPIEDDVIEALTHLVDNFPSLSSHWGLQEPFLGLQGLQQYCAYFLTPACTITSIQGGQPIKDYEAFIPKTASAQLDFQLVPGQDPIDIYARLQNHLLNQNHTDVQTRLLGAVRPTYTPLSDPFVRFVIQATTSAYGQPPQILPLISPHLLQNSKLPTVIIPLSFSVPKPSELFTRARTESLMKYIKQQTLIMAKGANEIH